MFGLVETQKAFRYMYNKKSMYICVCEVQYCLSLDYYFCRNNVLHLWPWTIEDLKSLGAKHFFPRFCTGTMNHISIKRLQCILLKAALVMGVEIVPGVEFNDVLEPETEMDSWKLSVKPLDHAINNRGIDVVIGAED